MFARSYRLYVFPTISMLLIDFGLKSSTLRFDLENWITGRIPWESSVNNIYPQL